MTAAEIRSLRKSLSLTQYDLSNLLRVRRETIVRWERPNGPRPHPSHLNRLRELAMEAAERLAMAKEAVSA